MTTIDIAVVCRRRNVRFARERSEIRRSSRRSFELENTHAISQFCGRWREKRGRASRDYYPNSQVAWANSSQGSDEIARQTYEADERSDFRWQFLSLILERRGVDGATKRANRIRSRARDSSPVFIFITGIYTTRPRRMFFVISSCCADHRYFSFGVHAGACDVNESGINGSKFYLRDS